MTTVGGQAVLEGVMMRSPSNWAVAVRKPDGDIAQVHQPIKSPMARHRIWRLPVIRGVIALGESLAIGFRALAISANYQAQVEGKEGEEGKEVATELTRAQLIFAFAIAIGFAILLFKVSPALITDWIGIEAGWFVSVEVLIRVTIFVLCLSLISTFPALRHGLPAVGDGDRHLRLLVLRSPSLVLADRHPHPAAARDRGSCLRADP